MENKNDTLNIRKRYLNTVELAGYLGKSKWWIYKKVKLREIPFIPVGREPRFDLVAIDNWMTKKTIKAFTV